jgi:hypothetical protein
MLDKYFTESEIDKLVEIGPEKVREIFHNKGGCRCKDCEELRDNAAKHLESHFYTEANQYRERERIGQIVKGAEKYPEPFNPASWTAKELLQHAMQENIDQGHYIYGLFEKIEAMEQELEKYKNRCKDYEIKINKYDQELKFAKQDAEYWRLKAIKGYQLANDLENTLMEMGSK